ncbi:MAG: uroporphyrinogen-III synthase [Bacillus sp. (in: firmicutes)]
MDPVSALQGKTVLITREESDGSRFAENIAKRGGIPITIPLIGFQTCPLPPEMERKLAAISQYDWIIFTSKNGVKYFFQRWKKPLMQRIAVIGEKTKIALESRGYEPQFVPTEYVAERFAAEFLPCLEPDARVLIVKGNLARSIIADAIKKQGFHCDEMVMYETILPEASESKLCDTLKKQKCDIISFTSSSTVRHFMQIVEKHHLQECIAGSKIACIGPIAKKTAERLGLYVHICAEKYTMEGLVRSMETYCAYESAE